MCSKRKHLSTVHYSQNVPPVLLQPKVHVTEVQSNLVHYMRPISSGVSLSRSARVVCTFSSQPSNRLRSSAI